MSAIAYRSRIGQELRTVEKKYKNPKITVVASEVGASKLKEAMAAPPEVRTNSMKVDGFPVEEGDDIDGTYEIRLEEHDGLTGHGVNLFLESYDGDRVCLVSPEMYEDMSGYSEKNCSFPVHHDGIPVYVLEGVDTPLLADKSVLYRKQYI